ncbi:MAG: hypothetical protein ACTSR3_11085 [Candidatus Helarchaeota archaeon]
MHLKRKLSKKSSLTAVVATDNLFYSGKMYREIVGRKTKADTDYFYQFVAITSINYIN